MASHPSPKRAVENPTIPDRLYFKIGDVARILKLEPYVLRFWESQFPQLKPNKSGTGQRLYPDIQFEDGSWYREQSKDMEKTIRAGRLMEKAGAQTAPTAG